MRTISPAPRKYTPQQHNGLILESAARIAGVSRKVVKRWCLGLGLPHTKSPTGRIEIDPSALAMWLQANRPAFRQKRPDFKPRTSDDDTRGGVVYALVDPRPERTGQVRYIGKTESVKDRKKEYRRQYGTGEGHSPQLCRWFRKLKGLGLVPEFKILEECLFGLNAKECEWIEKARRKGWPILNCMSGGIGGKKDEATKRRLSEISKAKWATPEYQANWEAARVRRWCSRTGLTAADYQQRRQDQAHARMTRIAQRKARTFNGLLAKQLRKARYQPSVDVSGTFNERMGRYAREAEMRGRGRQATCRAS